MKLRIAPISGEYGGPLAPGYLVTTETDLGGVFYDYLLDVSGEIVGIRYYLMKNVNFRAHPVYNQFLDDTRFVFRANEFVDMVVEERYASALQQGSLSLDVVQDFDGIQVVKSQGQFVIVVDLQFGLPDS